MSQQRPHNAVMDAIVGGSFWKVLDALDSHVPWSRDVQDGNKGKSYFLNPLSSPVSVFEPHSFLKIPPDGEP